ncbi:MAG: pentapeptide repeat-containing protein [Cytophagales bacterium]|nr:pentapeptide repeat-containing protein [Cytophagales bacterium]
MSDTNKRLRGIEMLHGLARAAKKGGREDRVKEVFEDFLNLVKDGKIKTKDPDYPASPENPISQIKGTILRKITEDKIYSKCRKDGIDLGLADLRWTKLMGANLQGAHLSWANLQEAGLQWANLQKADLQMADLRNTSPSYLQGADLRGAKLYGDDILQHPKLQGANLWAIKIESTKEKPVAWLGRHKPKKYWPLGFELNYAFISNYEYNDEKYEEHCLPQLLKRKYDFSDEDLKDLRVIWIEDFNLPTFKFRGESGLSREDLNTKLNKLKEGLESEKETEKNPERKNIIENEIRYIGYAMENLEKL